MKWNPSNREWYTSKGYIYTYWHEEFEVYIKDLSPTSQAILEFKCDYCGEDHTRTYEQFFKIYKNNTSGKHSCNECKSSREEENKITSNAKLLDRIKINDYKNHYKVEINTDTFIYIKSCSKCGKYKELDCFNKNNRNGVWEYQKQCTECYEAYRILNRGMIRLYHVKESSMYMNLPIDITEKKLDQIYNRFKGKCALSASVNTVFEHFIPVSWGHGGTYTGNVYLLQDTLNLSKGNLNPFEWIRRNDVKKKINMKKWYSLIKYLATKNKLTTKEFKEYVYWCEKNKRTAEEVKRDGNISSLELWKLSKER